MAFLKLLREAAKHFTQHGYTSQADINDWRVRLLSAAEQHLDPEDAHRRIGARSRPRSSAIGAGRIAKRHGSVHRWTIDRLEPQLTR